MPFIHVIPRGICDEKMKERESNMKKLEIIGTTICVSILLMQNASAYLDPSVMTYTVQVVAGVVVAAGAVIGIYWRKAKRKVQNKLGIDEDTKKEREEDIIPFSDENE